MRCIYKIVTDLWIGGTYRTRVLPAEPKEIDNRGWGEYHEAYPVSHLRSA